MTREWYEEKLREAFLTISDQETIRAQYQTVTGESFEVSFRPNCPNRFRDAITLILVKMKQEQNTSRGGYLLKQGVVFKYKGKIITNVNLTAASAEWYIAQNLDHRDDFEELGRDYDSFGQTETMK